MLENLPQQQRFTPNRFIPGKASDHYVCPVCSHEVPRYRLMTDWKGTARAIDVAGCPCSECISRLENWIDDGK